MIWRCVEFKTHVSDSGIMPNMSEPAEELMPQLPQCSSQPLMDSSHPGSSPARPQVTQRLCGWLEKRGGPLKMWKTRWFSHDTGRSLLLYWRTPQDATPLGGVELSGATFNYEVQGEPGCFRIETPQRTVTLKAVNYELMMYWLQQLQLIRDTHANLDTQASVEFLPQVEMPLGFVGEDAASRPTRGLSSPLNISLKHPLIELQNLRVRRTVSHLDQAPVLPLATMGTPTLSTSNQESISEDTPTLSTSNQESTSEDTLTHGTASQESTSEDTPSHNTTNQETTSEDTSTQDTASQEPTTEDTPTQDTANQETASFDTSTQYTSNLDTPTKKTTNQETTSLDTPTENTTDEESSSFEMLSKDAANQETVSNFTSTMVAANQRSSYPTLPAQIKMRSLPSPKTQCRKKGLSATLTHGHRGNDQTTCLEVEMLTLEEELRKQKELVLSLYKALEASQKEKRACADFLSTPGEEERLELLRHRERQVAKLQAEGEDLQQQLRQRDKQVCELQEALQLMLQKNQAKQEVVLKLSQQLADWAGNTHTHAADTHAHAADTHAHAADAHAHAADTNSASGPAEKEAYLKQEIRHLMDDLEAYRMQNKFLNSEIHHLTQLWRQSSQQEKSLLVKCACIEARSCEKEREYLSVLRQLREISAWRDTHTQEHTLQLRELIDEALQGALSLSPTSEFDAYGFKLVPEYTPADMQLLMQLNAVELRSRSLQCEEEDRPLVARWSQLLLSSPSGPTHCPTNPAHLLCPSLELKMLLRAGIPLQFRACVWRWLIGCRTRAVREQHPDHYRLLVQRSQSAPGPASQQIQLDLHRTLTSNQKFSSPPSPAHEQLRRILLAFSCHSPTVSYCQGLNRIAALALIVLEDEEEAFWCLVAIVESIMPPDYYIKPLLGCQVDQCVFQELLAEKVPRVSAHLESHSVDVSHVNVSWFPVLFLETLPCSDLLLPVWDAFLYEGSKVLFRYALALLKYKEEEIVKIQDGTEIFQYLFLFPKTITNARRLRGVAFGELNPFPMKHLRSRRVWHRERLEAELRAQEAVLMEQSAQPAERHDKALDDVASDDELN